MSAPEILKAGRAQFGISNCVLDVLVAQVRLQGAGVVSSVGQRVPASMPQHVRVYFERELGLDPSTFDHPRETSGRKGRAPLRDKDEG